MYKPHAFQLTAEEFAALKSQSMTSSAKAADLQGLHSNWSQFVTSSRKHRGARYRPYAFTEQGVAMLSSVLRSRRAVEVNIAIMRTFVQLRRLMDTNRDLARKIEALEKNYDEQFAEVFAAIREITDHETPLFSLRFRMLLSAFRCRKAI
jgi:hypothetical protein